MAARGGGTSGGGTFGGSLAQATSMLWRTVGFLSVSSQRRNLLVREGDLPGTPLLAGCTTPSLAEQVTGQLGRPLSETP